MSAPKTSKARMPLAATKQPNESAKPEDKGSASNPVSPHEDGGSASGTGPTPGRTGGAGQISSAGFSPGTYFLLLQIRSEIERRAEVAGWSARVSMILLLLAVLATGSIAGLLLKGLALLGNLFAGLFVIARWSIVEQACQKRKRLIEERIVDAASKSEAEWYIRLKWDLSETQGQSPEASPSSEMAVWILAMSALTLISFLSATYHAWRP